MYDRHTPQLIFCGVWRLQARAIGRPGRRLRSTIEERTQIFHQQEEIVRICGTRLEVEALVSRALPRPLHARAVLGYPQYQKLGPCGLVRP